MPAEDDFDSKITQLNSPINGGFDIEPDDGADLDKIPRALMVATGGDVAVILRDGTALTLPELAPGVIYPIRARRVLVTGTVASGIVGLY